MACQTGQEVLKHIRETYGNSIIIVSVQNGVSDIVSALDSGANDYLVASFRTGYWLALV